MNVYGQTVAGVLKDTYLVNADFVLPNRSDAGNNDLRIHTTVKDAKQILVPYRDPKAIYSVSVAHQCSHN